MDARNFLYMFYGFAAVWGILFAYVILMALRERKLDRALAAARRMIEESGRK